MKYVHGLKQTNVAVEVAHGQVHHAAVAPEAARVEGQPVGQQPHLGGHGVVALPLHHLSSQCRENWNEQQQHDT